MGYPERAIPFLHAAHNIDPTNVTAEFNLAVAYLLKGDFERGWQYYEARWRYEHMAGVKPNLSQPEWTGQDLKDKIILLVGEQGLGDQIQFVRFAANLTAAGAKIKLVLSEGVKALFPDQAGGIIGVYKSGEDLGEFDYWIPIMSIPGVLGITLENLPQDLQYIEADKNLVQEWQKRLGFKNRLRVGFCWSGRRDTWINQHKAMPFIEMLTLIKQNPDYEWINLQIDCTPEEEQILIDQ
jgi:hypothetical protein